ncbi:MAG: endonuclease/exonuclease/phosphatase family protein, partial [Crocinitomicaceae bacterium]
MRFTTLIAFVITIFISQYNFSQEEHTIGFYNVENLFDTIKTPNKNDNEFLPNGNRVWNSEKYNEKINHINKVLVTMQKPIIVGFCEIENEAVVRDIVKGGELSSTHGVVHFESLDQRGIDNAIAYDSTKLGLAESGIIRYEMPGNSSPSRDIVWAKFHCGTDTILALVNHWPSRRGGQIESEPKRLVAAYAAK